MSHIGGATMARYFRRGRGTAVSVSNLGFPAAQALLPPPSVALMPALGWRGTWLVIAALLAAVVLALALWLLRGHGERERQFQRDRATATADEGERDWLLSEVLRNPHFYLVVPTIAFTPFLVTGVFFHQSHVATLKGWPQGLFATAFVAYAAASLVGMLLSGPLIDRVGARRLVAFLLAPLGCALLALAVAGHWWAAFAFMIGAGLTSGAGLNLLSALWAEMYGAEHIGAPLRGLDGDRVCDRARARAVRAAVRRGRHNRGDRSGITSRGWPVHRPGRTGPRARGPPHPMNAARP